MFKIFNKTKSSTKQTFLVAEPTTSASSTTPLEASNVAPSDASMMPPRRPYNPDTIARCSKDELQAIYTGGSCYELALALHDYDPLQFSLWEFTSRIHTDNIAGKEYSAHWFVKDNTTGKYLDAYGPHKKLKDIHAGWPDFEGDTTIKYYEHTDRSVAVARIDKEFSAEGLARAFQSYWREDALHAAKRLKLI